MGAGKTWLGYTCCRKNENLKQKKCNDKLCTSPNGKGGHDCWAGNGEPFSCKEGYSFRLNGKSVPWGGKNWLGYTCCETEKDERKDCNHELCTSPNGRGGHDCWAGNGEPYSCQPGYSYKLNGKNVPWAGKTWLGYTCCRNPKEDLKSNKPKCDDSLCTSSNGRGGHDCWAGNGEAFTCRAGYSFKLNGRKVPWGGKTWLGYTCCENAKDELTDCNEKLCRSSNGKGGHDCWA